MSWPMFSAWLIAFIFVMPVLALVFSALQPDEAIFSHLFDTVLFDYIYNTFILVVLVSLFSLAFGVPSAWLMAMCDFKFKRFFSWALILPLAMPAYVVAYIYTDLFDYAGPIQISLRDWFGWQSPNDYWFFDIRSLGGAAVVLALVLFPYVYLLMRSAFANISKEQLQASRILGDSAWRSFLRIQLPQSRGLMIAALALVGMETLADFATVHYFAVNTLTTAVYDTWLGYYSLPAAAKISVFMLVFVFVLLGMEKYQRRKQAVYSRSDTFSDNKPIALTGKRAWLAIGYCSLLFIAGFLLPFAILIEYAFSYFDEAWNDSFITYSWHTLLMALGVAVICVIISCYVNLTARAQSHCQSHQIPGHLLSLGYALPGTVLAIAVLIPMSFIEHQINDYFALWFDWQPGLFLSGTVTVIIFAYCVRFIAICIGATREGLAKISPNLDAASLSMGVGPKRTAMKIHLPLLTKVMLTSGLLVFIEAMKELPAALLLRPFGFETLATYVYQYVSDEMLEQASLAAIVIVLVGLIPLIFVNRNMESRKA
ncbi:iron ABC transporter permease [Catenovulum sp. SM1970]|uniref:ABC transporter permease n=1 Tax=Marinifaba aquimaris TaxID=2741323 RepID=UPI001573FF54|nr:iron ABC transporter permease [Marinifaba aquimaris]